MNQVVVVENFLDDEELLNSVNEAVLDLDYGLHTSSGDSDTTFFASTKPFIENGSVFRLFDKIIKFGSENGMFKSDRSVDCIRSYVNANPSGEAHGGTFHYDDGDVTALFFPSEWDSSWGGGLEFKDGSVIEYKRNTLILFDAKIPHRAMPHTKRGMRFSIAFKLEILNKPEGFDPHNEDSISH